MNTNFTLKNVEFQLPQDVTIKIGELSTSVTDYNILEGLQVAKAIPGILRELKDVIVEGIMEVRTAIESDIEDFMAAEDPHSVVSIMKDIADLVSANSSQGEEIAEDYQKELEAELALAEQDTISVPLGDDGVTLTARVESVPVERIWVQNPFVPEVGCYQEKPTEQHNAIDVRV